MSEQASLTHNKPPRLSRRTPFGDEPVPSESAKTTIDAGESFESWHQVTCRNYSSSQLRRPSDAAFSARISMRRFGALALSDVSSRSGEAELIRGATDIRKDHRDHFMLFLVTEGEIGIAQDSREARAQAGDLFLYDQTRPLTLAFQQQYRAWMLNIPRSMLEPRLARPRGSTAIRISGESPLGALAGTIIRQLDAFGPETAGDVIDKIATSTLDIVVTALDVEARGGARDQAAHQLLTRAETFLSARLQDADLTIETISRALNTSPRTLNRVFAGEGTTPMRWLWRRRLEAARRALADGRARNVTDAAFDYGFNDASHFSRAFKGVYGRPPVFSIAGKKAPSDWPASERLDAASDDSSDSALVKMSGGARA